MCVPFLNTIAVSSVFAAGNTKKTAAFVGLYPYGSTDEIRITKKILKYLAQNNSVLLINQSDVIKFLKGKRNEEAEKVKNLKESLEKGIKKVRALYDDLRVKKSLREISRLHKKIDADFMYLRNSKSLLLIYLYKAMNFLALGKKKKALAALTDMIRYDTKRKKHRLNPVKYPPTLIKLFESAKDKVINGSKSSLSVTGSPLGARVYLDGSLVGKIPLSLHEIPVGDHYLAVVKSGYRPYGARIYIDVGPNEEKIDLNEIDLYPTVSPSEIEGGYMDELRNMALSLNANALILADFDEKNSEYILRGQIYDAMTNELGPVEKVSAVSVRDIEESIPLLLRKLLDRKHVVEGGDLTAVDKHVTFDNDSSQLQPPLQREGKGKPFYKKTWFWGIIAVAAAGSAAVFLLKGSGESGDPVIVIPNPGR